MENINFDVFSKTISAIKPLKLPANIAHLKMAPLERVRLLKEAKHLYPDSRKAAVMMLFYPKKSTTHLVLIVRNTYPGVHSSQIAFPGGKSEEIDANYEETALRETHEEVGISPEKIKVIKAFSEIYIPPSNFLVYPFLGIAETELEFKIQPEEVASIIELPLATLLDDSIIVSKILDTSYAKATEVPAFQIGEHLVWGATAMMLSELKDVLKMVF
jgi:8-oxo-dGTP pyrophosphatase MutT (NUDIX family)